LDSCSRILIAAARQPLSPPRILGIDLLGEHFHANLDETRRDETIPSPPRLTSWYLDHLQPRTDFTTSTIALNVLLRLARILVSEFRLLITTTFAIEVLF
jgi:hypothetical protein